MFVEDKIIRTAKNAVGKAFLKFVHKVDMENVYNYDNLHTIIDTLCRFYDGNSQLIFKLALEDRDEVLEALSQQGICLQKNAYSKLRTMVREVLRQRYRSPFDRITPKGSGVTPPAEMPDNINAYTVCGAFSFEDFVCLNNYDADRLKKELEKLAFTDRLSPTLRLVLDQMNDPDTPLGRIPYHTLAYSPSMRPYQRLRMLDEVLVEAEEALDLHTIDRRLRKKAEDMGIDIKTLWRLRSTSSNDESDLANRYEKDFQTLAEMIAVEPSHVNSTTKDLVYDFSSKGRRKYKNPEFSAFKLVLTSKEAEQIYKENPRFATNRMDLLAHFPMTCALAIYGKHHAMDSKEIPNSGVMDYVGYNLLNYYPDSDDYIIKKASDIIHSKHLLAVRQDKGDWYTYLPLEIRHRNGDWRLIVFDYKNNEFDSLTPTLLKEGIASIPERIRFDYSPECLIGLSAPQNSTPIRIETEMDYNTARKFLNNPDYTNMNLENMSDIAFLDSIEDPYQGPTLFGEPQDNTRLITLKFRIYPNLDFFDDLYQYSETGHLEILSPTDIKMKYDNYCKHRSIIHE